MHDILTWRSQVHRLISVSGFFIHNAIENNKLYDDKDKGQNIAFCVPGALRDATPQKGSIIMSG